MRLAGLQRPDASCAGRFQGSTVYLYYTYIDKARNLSPPTLIRMHDRCSTHASSARHVSGSGSGGSLSALRQTRNPPTRRRRAARHDRRGPSAPGWAYKAARAQPGGGRWHPDPKAHAQRGGWGAPTRAKDAAQRRRPAPAPHCTSRGLVASRVERRRRRVQQANVRVVADASAARSEQM